MYFWCSKHLLIHVAMLRRFPAQRIIAIQSRHLGWSATPSGWDAKAKSLILLVLLVLLVPKILIWKGRFREVLHIFMAFRWLRLDTIWSFCPRRCSVAGHPLPPSCRRWKAEADWHGTSEVLILTTGRQIRLPLNTSLSVQSLHTRIYYSIISIVLSKAIRRSNWIWLIHILYHIVSYCHIDTTLVALDCAATNEACLPTPAFWRGASECPGFAAL